MIVKDIYCYYEELGNPNEPPLIEYWAQRWKREGWNPVVMCEADARKDPRFATMEAKHDSFPCLPGHYEYGRANFRRWLAWSSLTYAAVCDYDVFPMRPFPPKDVSGFICASGSGGPGFIIGTGKDFSGIADAMLAYEARPEDQWKGIPHVSDMNVLHLTKARYDKILHTITSYPCPCWDKMELCHFDNTPLIPYNKVSRVNKIRAILESVYP